MLKIAHRGNTNGPSHRENQESYLREALAEGYDIELDLWRVSGRLWLGHSGPEYLTSEEFLIDTGHASWIHCKNLEALEFLSTVFPQLNFFWHQIDDFTLTSQGYIWTYPDQPVTKSSVIVDLTSSPPQYEAYGICADYLKN